MRAFRKAACQVIGPIVLGWNAWSLAAAAPVEPGASPSGMVETVPLERPAEGPGGATAQPAEPTPRGNPLWAIPLEDLVATRERPIFSPSRRPPPPAMVAAPPAPPPPAPSDPPRPPLELIGTVLNGREGYGVFLDQAANAIVRLRIGEIHDGWILRSISGRKAMLQKDRNSAVLALAVPDADEVATPAASDEDKPTAKILSSNAPTANKPRQAPPPKPIFYPEH